MVGEVPQGNGISRRMDEALITKVNTYCILNSENMQKWVKRYDDAKAKRTKEREIFWNRTRSRNYPPELSILPPNITIDWLHRALTEARANGEFVSDRE